MLKDELDNWRGAIESKALSLNGGEYFWLNDQSGQFRVRQPYLKGSGRSTPLISTIVKAGALIMMGISFESRM
jgi:hypothetical protein